MIASALVLVLTGAAWGIYRDVTAGITTTDVAGGANFGPQDILIVGVDSRTDAQGNPLPPEVLAVLNSGDDEGVLNSDTIILLHVPDGGGAAVAFSIPRDTYVDIPGYRDDKINAAYPATKALKAEELVADGVTDPARVEAEAARVGRRALIETVEDLTGVTVEHYAEINLLGFYNLTTAIGGVDVCLKAPTSDVLSGADFPAGPQTISGADALAFVRQRHGLPDSDFSRIRRQQVFLAAVADKVLSSGTLTNPGTLAALIDVVQQSLVIDEGWDLLAFAQQASGMAGGNLEFLTIPTLGPTVNERGDVVLVEKSEVRRFVEDQITEADALAEGEAPPAPEVPAPAAPTTGIEAGRYTVDVLNATGVGRLADQVADRMSEQGFGQGVVGNNDELSSTSSVRYSGDDAAGAQAVAAQLGGLTVEPDADVDPGHVRVLIGEDFDPAVLGPDTAPPPAAAPITAAGVPCID